MSEGRVGETYNIGAHDERRNIDVVHEVCSLLEELAPKKPKGVSQYSQLITYISDRPGHDYRYAIDAQKIKNELNWAPDETFKSGLLKTVQWFLTNREWCLRVQSHSRQLQLGLTKESS